MKHFLIMPLYSSTTQHPFTFDAEKALEAILYIASRTQFPSIIYICKVLYFADKLHLEEYGRFICGDHYVAMTNGPVPSGTYDIIKSVRYGKTQPFTLHGNDVKPLREADQSLLSESDMESLDRAIKDYGGLSVGRLIRVSHDAAWNSADENSMIPVESIASTLRDGEAIIKHVHGRE